MRLNQDRDSHNRRRFGLTGIHCLKTVPEENAARGGLSIDAIFETAPWLLAEVDREQRIRDIRERLAAGTYAVPAEKLAPILLRIFRSMKDAEPRP